MTITRHPVRLKLIMSLAVMPFVMLKGYCRNIVPKELHISVVIVDFGI